MKANAKEFSASLGRLAPVFKTFTTMPILTCVKLEASNGVLLTTATNLDAYACSACPCDGDLSPVCVNAAMLNYLVRREPESIELSIDENRLKVQGNGTAQLGLYELETFPPWPLEKPTPLGVPVTDLAECINGVSWATDFDSRISIDLWKECVWVKTTAKSLECCGTDSREFAYVNRPLICAPAEFMFPARQADLLVFALNTGATGVGLSESFLSTTSNTFQVAIKLAEGKYIPVRFLLDQPKTELGVIDMVPILESLHTIKALGKDEEYIEAQIEIDTEKIWLEYKGQGAKFVRAFIQKLLSSGKASFDVLRAIRVFSRVQPGSKAYLNDRSILFSSGDFTYALGLLKR